MPRREYLRMELFAAEAIKRDRDAAIKAAIKNKVPVFEISEAFGLSEAEVGLILVGENRTMSQRPDDIKDARTEPMKGGLIRGR